MDFHPDSPAMPASLASPASPAARSAQSYPTPTATAATAATKATAAKKCLSTLSLNTVHETICYLHKYNVLVCKEHSTAIQNLDAHLRTHHAVASKLRKEIVASYQEAWIQDPQDMQLPGVQEPPIPELGAPLDGFQCVETDCNWRTVNIDELRKHRKKQHSLAWKGNSSAHQYKEVKMQTFFSKPALRRYFLVSAVDASQSSSTTLSTRCQTAATVKEQLAEWDTTKQAHQEKAQIMDAEVAKTDKTGWFKRTGWLEHFAGRNLIHLAHQARLPDRDEMKLQRAAKLVELLVEQSVQGLSTLGRETRRWLRSAKRQEVDQRPLARLQNPESQARYAGYMVKFVCYFLRIIADADQRLAQEESKSRSSNRNRGSERDSDSDSNSDSSGLGPDSSADEDQRYQHARERKKETNLIKDGRELFIWQDNSQAMLAITLWNSLNMDINKDNKA